MAGWSLLLVLCLVVGGCGAGEKGGTAASHPSAARMQSDPEHRLLISWLARSQQLKGYSYSYSITINGQQRQGKAWAAGEKRRSESVVDGQKLVTLYDGQRNIVYSYYPQRGEATKMRAEDTPDLIASPEDYLDGIRSDRLQGQGTVMYRGIKCRLMLARDLQSQAVMKLWVNPDLGLPVRVESSDPDGNTCIVEYKDLKAGTQPANLFQLPRGVKVTDLEKLLDQPPEERVTR